MNSIAKTFTKYEDQDWTQEGGLGLQRPVVEMLKFIEQLKCREVMSLPKKKKEMAIKYMSLFTPTSIGCFDCDDTQVIIKHLADKLYSFLENGTFQTLKATHQILFCDFLLNGKGVFMMLFVRALELALWKGVDDGEYDSSLYQSLHTDGIEYEFKFNTGGGQFTVDLFFQWKIKKTRIEKKGIDKAFEACGGCKKLCLNVGVNPIMLKCGRCKQVRYCNKECQTADWKEHKKNCKKAE